jgi:hypothetical protein
LCVCILSCHVCDDACGALCALRPRPLHAALCGTAHTPAHRPGRPAATARVGPAPTPRGPGGRAGPPGGLAHGPWRMRWAGMARLGLRGLADACTDRGAVYIVPLVASWRPCADRIILSGPPWTRHALSFATLGAPSFEFPRVRYILSYHLDKIRDKISYLIFSFLFFSS